MCMRIFPHPACAGVSTMTPAICSSDGPGDLTIVAVCNISY
jgi:hypothetical protein